MNRYIGTKVINAIPMNRLEYNVFRGWELPKDENGADEGYLVEYADGGKPNTPQYAGYVSWSPKEQFDNAYKLRPAIEGALPHQQRVYDELAELCEKRAALGAFIASERFNSVDKFEGELLVVQLEIMLDYENILKYRIKGFGLKVTA